MSSSSSSSDDATSVVIEATFAAVKNLQEAYDLDSESDDEYPPVLRTRRYIERDRATAHERLMNDYFVENVTFQGYYFHRRFRMYKPLYEMIVETLTGSCRFFEQNPDARGIPGFTPLQKCTTALRQITYGIPADALHERFRMSAKTARIALHKFCKHIIRLFGPRYLRKPHVVILYSCKRIMQLYMASRYARGDHGVPTVILEAVASQDEWICHGFFGSPGSLNDINVLNISPLFDNIYDGSAPDSVFHVLGMPYKYDYYLVDEIYPEWVVFGKSWTHPHDEKRRKFKKAQERSRKDVERAFGALKKLWYILAKPALFFDVEKMKEVMKACIIMHNMIIEDEQRAICVYDADEVVPETQIIPDEDDDYLDLRSAIRHNGRHQSLRSDLVEHIYGVDHIDLNVPPPINDDLDFSDADNI